MKVSVKAKSAYGVLPVEEGAKWINADKEKEGMAALHAIVAGNTYELDKDNFFTSATLVGELKKQTFNGGNGKKGSWKKGYISSKPADNMSKAEWAAKDVRISRQGVVQSAVKAISSMGTDPNVSFDVVKELSDKMLEYVNKGE